MMGLGDGSWRDSRALEILQQCCCLWVHETSDGGFALESQCHFEIDTSCVAQYALHRAHRNRRESGQAQRSFGNSGTDTMALINEVDVAADLIIQTLSNRIFVTWRNGCVCIDQNNVLSLFRSRHAVTLSCLRHPSIPYLPPCVIPLRCRDTIPCVFPDRIVTMYSPKKLKTEFRCTLTLSKRSLASRAN